MWTLACGAGRATRNIRWGGDTEQPSTLNFYIVRSFTSKQLASVVALFASARLDLRLTTGSPPWRTRDR